MLIIATDTEILSNAKEGRARPENKNSAAWVYQITKDITAFTDGGATPRSFAMDINEAMTLGIVKTDVPEQTFEYCEKCYKEYEADMRKAEQGRLVKAQSKLIIPGRH